MTTTPRLPSVLLIVACCSALFTAAATAAAVVELPADPPARRSVALVEQWRLGAEDEDVLLGVITGAVRDPAGRTYLVDRQLSQVLVISADGTYETTLGREGDGPGELRNPHELVLLPDDAVGVVHGFPGRIIGIDTHGDPAGNVTFGGGAEQGGFVILRRCIRVGDRYVADAGRMVFDQENGDMDRTMSLAVYDLAGNETALIAAKSARSNFNDPVYDERAEFSGFAAWAAAPDGRVYTAPERDAWVIRVCGPDGAELATWRRPFTPRRRTAAEKDDVGSGFNVRANGRDLEVDNRILDTDPAIMNLTAGPDGRLYVTDAHDTRAHLPAGTAARYDVLAPDGALVEELTLTFPGFDGTRDALLFLDGEHFVVIRNFEGATAAMERAPGEESAEDGQEAAPLEVVGVKMGG